jgi:hypothetical protein
MNLRRAAYRLGAANCPECGKGPAYHGFAQVECPTKGCKNFTQKQHDEVHGSKAESVRTRYIPSKQPSTAAPGRPTKPREEIFQESPRLKAKWLKEWQSKLPVGKRVRVKEADLDHYVGATGTVVDHNVGNSGDYPTISVEFDPGAIHPKHNPPKQDGFYDDELEPI